jgi:PAS domain S-box-containing protein
MAYSPLSELTSKEKQTLPILKAWLEERAPELTRIIIDLFLNTAFENQYTLHPRQMMKLASTEVENIITFFGDADLEQAKKAGEESQREGMGVEPCLTIRPFLRDFLSKGLGSEHKTELLIGQKLLDVYMNAFISGYIKSLSEETLQNQEQIRKALSAALESQRRELLIKNHAIDTSINGIALTDLKGSITYVNPNFIKMWGHGTDEELLGRSILDFVENGEELLEAMPQSEGWKGESTGSSADGSRFDTEITASTIRDNAGNPVGIMISFVDITERKHLEVQFRQAQKMEALGQLAGGIVHDFNNLLAAVSGFTQLALMDVPKEGQQHQDFMQIKIATDRGKGLTDQLRIFTRQATGEYESLSVNKIVDETATLLKRTFPKELTIKMKLDGELWPIEADASQLSQLLMNLCVNARDAMMHYYDELVQLDQPGGGSLTLETKNIRLDRARASRYLNAKPGQYVRLKVADTGEGMPPEVIDRLYEPFFTTKSDHGGTGLGLAVVYGIVHNHRGFIDVTSRPGVGSTFEIYLPVTEVLEMQKESRPRATGLVLGKGTVLVVEDERQIRNIATRTLEKCGYNVLAAENGLAALSLFEENPKVIDLVVLDIVMPKMGGRVAFRQMKTIRPDVKVICITGYTADSSSKDLLEEGVLRVLEKPLDLHEFSQAAHDAINGS